MQALGEAISRVAPPQSERISVGRDGASDAISFLEAGVPAVECGPAGAGHHGPEEWVSIRSLGEYREALVEFVTLLPARLGPRTSAGCASPDRCFDDIPRPGLWKRLLLGALLVIFAAAGATAVAAFNEVDKVVDALKLGPELKLSEDSLAETDPGEPQTLMILGSDKRPKDNAEGAASDARSDTIMLVRLDPDKEATAIMSLPRDLKVEIPGHGTDKINAAY